MYEIYQSKIADCERAIIEQLNTYPDATDGEPPAPAKQSNPSARIRSGVDLREMLYKKSGVDLFAVPGLGADTLLTVSSEVGFDMSPWKTVKHFTSWLSLCPGTRISGGKELKKRGKRKANRAAQAFRIGAATLGRSQTALGAFYRRIKAQHGGQHAVTATAHKIARIYYTMLTEGTAYVEVGQKAYEQKYQERRFTHLQRQARSPGLQLVPC